MKSNSAQNNHYNLRLPLNILQANYISANFNDEITQIVLNPVQYFLKEDPLSN